MPATVVLCALVLALGLGPVLHAQPTEVLGEQVFGEQVDVRVVNLEVVVEDADGRRVHGLERGDLRVLVDGRAVPVDFFAEVRNGHRASGTTRSTPSVCPPTRRSATSRRTGPPHPRRVGRRAIGGPPTARWAPWLCGPAAWSSAATRDARH